MTQLSSQQEQTVDFFDKVAEEYDNKYRSKELFYSYFFWQRIFEATDGFDFSNKSILDIGSGTGQLFEFLDHKYGNIDFVGTDISSNMLKQSNIPASSQYVGNLYQLDLESDIFDFVFMLGVSTYMTDEEWNRNLNEIKRIMKPGGHFIVSFTNKNSIDLKMRNLGSKPVRWLKNQNKVMGQNFRIHAYSIAEIDQLINGFEIEDVRWLNQTVFPFSKLFPKWSIQMANKIKRKADKDTLDKFSSDFLISAKLK